MQTRPRSWLTSRPVTLVSAVLMLTIGLGQAPALAQEEAPSEVTVDPPFVGAITYEEDFVNDDGGWQAHNAPAPPMTWEHGEPTSGPGDALTGDTVWATNLDGDYRSYECGVLLSPPIDLTEADSAQLEVDHWYDFYRSAWSVWDTGVFLVTADGDSYTKVVPEEGYDEQIGTSAASCLDLQRYATGLAGSSEVYKTSTLDLDAYTGLEIRVALGVASGSSSDVRQGWYVDALTLNVDGDKTLIDLDQEGFEVHAFEEPEQPRGWEWGTTSTATGPSFDEPNRLWGTHLDGDHGQNECATITSPPIEVTHDLDEMLPHAALHWDQWYRSSAASGGGVVQIGVDGEYANIEPTNGYPASPHQALDECLEHETQGTGAFAGSLQTGGDDMASMEADISEYIGEEITIRYVFATTDSIFQVDGWYVDNVRIEIGVGADPITIDVPNPADIEASAFQPLDTVYAEDFESNDGDWTVTGSPTWEWGTPVSPPDVPFGSLNMWGTDLLGEPYAGACSTVQSPTIELPDLSAPGVETAQLTLENYRDLAPGADGAIVLLEAEDGHNYLLEPENGYDGLLWWWDPIFCLGYGYATPVWTQPSDGWQEDRFDLSPFMGQEVQLKIVHASAPDDPQRGLYLDGATIEVGVGGNIDGAVVQDPVQAYTETCPSDLPGWDVQGPGATWCKAVPLTGPPTLDPVWATNPHGAHGFLECSYLVTDPIDTNAVPGIGTLTLSIDHFIDANRGTGGQVQVSDDGGATWTTVDPEDAFTPTETHGPTVNCLEPGSDEATVIRSSMDGYEEDTFTLRGYDGDTLQFRFAFAAYGQPALGWYIENAELTKGAGALPLTALSAAPTLEGATSQENAGPSEDLLNLAGPELYETIQEGTEDPLKVILTGPPHEEAPSFDDRHDAMSYFEASAEPFFEDARAIVETYGGEVHDLWASAPAMLVSAPLPVLEVLAQLDGVEHMEEDKEEQIELIEPLPPDESEDGIGLMNTEGRTLIQAEEAWAEGFTGEGVTISVIDTGIDGAHEAFLTEEGETRIIGWLDLVNEEEDPYDDHGHGTHVAATAAGSDDYDHPQHGAFQETGVAPDADLIGVKFLNAGGSGYLSDALDALEFSFVEGANLTSNSWGANCGAVTSIISMVHQLTSQGMLSVFAAGNSGPSSGTIGGPACGEDSITVGSTDANGEISSFSSRGPCQDPVRDTPERVCPDLVAKGENVRSAVPRSGASGADPSGYATWSGTSMATPHVAGAVALIEQMKIEETETGWDTASGADKGILMETSKPLPNIDSEPNNDYGEGLPQVMSVLHVLTAGEEAFIVDTFTLEDDELRIGERTDYGFTVRNYGTVSADGAYEATMTLPDGTERTLLEEETTLGYLDQVGIADTFRVNGDTLPGEYVFAGTFAYEWEDPETEETITGEIEHETTFTVVRPYVDVVMHGLDETALPGQPQPITFSAANIGNEDAQDVELRLTVPSEYEFIPDSAEDLTGDERYADPPPSHVHEDKEEVTLVWDVGSMPIGEEATFEMEIVGTAPGDYRFLGVATFVDEAGFGFAQGQTQMQTIQGPFELIALS